MHEWALAEAIVEYVKDAVGGHRKIKRLVVALGELQSIDEEILRFSITEILKSEGMSIDDLQLIEEEAVLRCRRCGHEWSLKEVSLDEEIRELIHFVPEAVHSYLKCPKCGSRDFEVVKGRGVKIVEVVAE
ncbi:MAG: hydrogenase nickel incorporation protein HypA [Desulfurococcales archaeon]|nr:hydrogenase nickel incorporation protein HypA [Desulfurococcales archaeon]